MLQTYSILTIDTHIGWSVRGRWNVMMAGAVLAALPTAIIYLLLGRYFIRGMLAGSVKG